jgi:hypothetical protein
MHYPEMWGFVQFSNLPAPPKQAVARLREADWPARWTLMRFYYHQKQYQKEHGHFAADADQLDLQTLQLGSAFSFQGSPEDFEAHLPGEGFTVHVNQDGRLWTTIE